jgi:hypothetical protein
MYTLYWDYEQFISLPDTLGARRRGRLLNCAVYYALWYGDARDFETNCVVIRARKMIDGRSRQLFPILAANVSDLLPIFSAGPFSK